MLLFSIAMNSTTCTPAKSILLVDDDQEVREAIRLLLTIDQHTVTEAGSGPEALQLLAGSSYDLVITDYLMPEMRGDELAYRIKSRAPAQPVLMITAYLERLAQIRQPVDAVLGKPISLDSLRRAMTLPIQATLTRDGAAGSLAFAFSPASLSHRASATTSILDEILRRKQHARVLPDWAGDL
jgi:CheY-like chemotaxis protein